MKALSNLIVFVVFLTAVFTCPTTAWGQAKDIEALARERAHHTNPGYRNSWISEERAGSTMRLLEWKISSNPYRKEKRQRPYFSVTRPDVKAISDLKPVMYRHSWYSSVRSMRTNVVIQYSDETP